MIGVLDDAIAADADWLQHPAISVITDSETGDAVVRTCLLVMHVARSVSDCPGWLEIPACFSSWARGHDVALPAGRVELRDLHEFVPTGAPEAIAIDPYARASGYVDPESWAAAGRLQRFAERWNEEFAMCSQALALLHDAWPSIDAWVASVAPVVTPLFATDTGRYRSRSRPELPGVVCIETHAGTRPFLESLVHEAAHRYFFLAEAGEALCADTPASFRSPLRPDARPLHAILFAYHALAYMSAFHRAYVRVKTRAHPQIAERLECELAEGRDVLREREDLLTPAGRDFLARTDEVAVAGAD